MVKKFELKKFEFKKNLKKKNLKKNFFFWSRHMSSQMWCFLKFPLHQGGGGGDQKSKLLRMASNMVSFWNFSDPMTFSKFAPKS